MDGICYYSIIIAVILPSTGHESNIAQPKADKCPSSTSHSTPFDYWLSVVFSLIKGITPKIGCSFVPIKIFLLKLLCVCILVLCNIFLYKALCMQTSNQKGSSVISGNTVSEKRNIDIYQTLNSRHSHHPHHHLRNMIFI